jgi:hypothetical protein
VNPGDIRRWAENHRAAQAKEAEYARRNRLTPAQSFALAMELLNFDEQMNGDPFARRDPVSEREDQEMWDAWAKLRAPYVGRER